MLTPEGAARAARFIPYLENDLSRVRARIASCTDTELIECELDQARRLQSDIDSIRRAVAANEEPTWDALHFPPFYAEADVDDPLYREGGAK